MIFHKIEVFFLIRGIKYSTSTTLINNSLNMICSNCSRFTTSAMKYTTKGRLLCFRLTCTCSQATPLPPTPSLTGTWVDDIGAREVNIKKSNGGTYSIYNKKTSKEEGYVGCDYDNLDNITLRTKWGKKQTNRTWRGEVQDGGTTIVWQGRRGTSRWYKCAE